jgi:cellulose synthase/poly-beta-1,6-N-acetylglucosamine synthase-like glycosyltransferase
MDNVLTRFFALEYHALFYVLLRGLERVGIPIPLGGTSNHMTLAHVRELGGWDPYNVTEDADLGVRISTHSYRTAMLDSYTLEEAPNKVIAWLRQRSRWIKGYMQTWLVYMRSPMVLYRVLGLRAFIGFQCFVGLPGFAFLCAPLLWGVTLLWAFEVTPFEQLAFSDTLLWISLLNLGVGLFIHWYSAFYCAKYYQFRLSGMKKAALLYPFYLVLHSLASYKALWQLLVKPHFWEKTEHGKAKTCINPLSESEEAY